MKTTRELLPVLVLFLVIGFYSVPMSCAPASAEAPTARPSRVVTWTGSMGAKVFPSGTTVVDLATEGIYDPATYGWAVVFDYTSIHVPSDAVVRFLNHPSRAPVIWHATGNILIEGEVDLDGADGHDGWVGWSYAEPGPGGHQGGRGSYHNLSGSSAGIGPGAGFLDEDPFSSDWGGPGSYGSLGVDSGDGRNGSPGPTYGSLGLFPLIGGSGGAGGMSQLLCASGGGGAGGGAILIAAAGQLVVGTTGSIHCDGGDGGTFEVPPGYYQHGGGDGSGGAIRLVGDNVEVQGSAVLSAQGGSAVGFYPAGHGRVRVEGNTVDVQGLISGVYSEVETIYEIIPAVEPTLQLIAMDPDGTGWVDISSLTADPEGELYPASSADVQVPSSGIIDLLIHADHIPPGEIVIVRVTHSRGQAITYSSTPLASTGSGEETEAEVQIDLTGGVSAVQLRVDYYD